MAKVAFLGIGAMGERMAANLLNAGHDLIVWNRTPAATETLVKAGATQAETPKEAAAAADYVIAMVRDDAASAHVWLDPETGALAGMQDGAVAIESSTITAAWSKELAAAVAATGKSFLEAPVSGSRPQAETATLIFLVGGDTELVEKAAPLLLEMGNAVHHVGKVGSGALVKLSVNALMGVEVTALAEVLGLLKSSEIDVENALETLSQTAIWSPMMGRVLPLMLADKTDPLFPVNLIKKDMEYALAACQEPDDLPMVSATQRIFQRAQEAGYAEQNMTSVSKLYSAKEN